MAMSEQTLVRECSADVANDVRAYWRKKLPRLERLLTHVSAELRDLQFHFDCAQDHYEAWAVLKLPTGTLVARSDPAYRDLHEAVDQVADRITAEVRRHKEAIRHDEVYRRKSRRRRDFMQLEPRLSSLRRNERRKEFFELLRPHLRHVRDHARRELVVAEAEGAVHPGELTPDDLLDEVIVRAWDEWDKRPPHVALDRWLVRLLHDVLDEKWITPAEERRSKPKPPPENAGSVYERVREDEPKFEAEDGDLIEANPDWPYAAENEWAVENNPYWPFVDPLTLDETLPDERSVEPWAEVADDELRRRILRELKRLPRQQRRAFELYALDGWTIPEIAEAQRRPAEQVRADIEAVRAALRDRLADVPRGDD